MRRIYLLVEHGKAALSRSNPFSLFLFDVYPDRAAEFRLLARSCHFHSPDLPGFPGRANSLAKLPMTGSLDDAEADHDNQ